MASIAMRAAAKEALIQNPASFYCQFLRIARFDTIEAQVTVVHQGKRAESIRVSLIQDGKQILEGLLRTALPGKGLEHSAFSMPKIPAPETLHTRDELSPNKIPSHAFWNNIEGRVVQPKYFDKARDPMPPHWLEWYRFRPRATFTDPFMDAARSLVLLDTIGWPAVWLHHPEPDYLAPNLDVMAFFHAPMNHSEWLLCEHESPIGHGGLVGTQGRIFDLHGQLVASGGAQLMCMPTPKIQTESTSSRCKCKNKPITLKAAANSEDEQ